MHSIPENQIVSHFSIEPSEDFDFCAPIQPSKLVFDLCGIHNVFPLSRQLRFHKKSLGAVARTVLLDGHRFFRVSAWESC
jgi:hypothetical protein